MTDTPPRETRAQEEAKRLCQGARDHILVTGKLFRDCA